MTYRTDYTRDYLASYGSAHGVWAVDATSGKGTPANATEWSNLFDAAGLVGAPSHTHSCQQSATPLSDGTGAMHLAAVGITGTLAYQQAVTGWSRLAVATTGDNHGWDIAGGTGPNPAVESVAMFVYAEIVSSGG